MKNYLLLILLSSLLGLNYAQAQHINAGAIDSDANGSPDRLSFINGSAFVNTSGYIFTATYRSNGAYAGYYDLGPSFTALAAFTHSGQPGQDDTTASPFAVQGSFLQLQLVSVSGPANGTFSYWNVGAIAPTFSLEAGTSPVGNEAWNLSDPSITWLDGTPSAGTSGGDPYGHIHGQRFTVDLPGTYTAGFQIIDTAATHLTASDPFYITVAAVPEPSTYALLLAGAVALSIFVIRRKPALRFPGKNLQAVFGLVVLLAGFSSTAFAHVHINAGVTDSNNNGVADQNDQLYFTNGSFYQAGSYTWNLTFQIPGQDYQGFYVTNVPPPVDSGFTFSVQPATLMNGGPAFNHPAFGSFIELRIVSVTGPDGGHLSWWDADSSESPTATFATGLSNGNFQFNLSEGANSAGSDPYGHVHGRTFGVDLPGSYIVGLQLVDTSTYGVGGGPIAAASDIYYMNFNAVPEPSTWICLGVGICLILFVSWKHKKMATPVAMILFACMSSLHSQTKNPAEAPGILQNPWTTLSQQSGDLLQALKKQDMPQIHELSETIGDEAAQLLAQPAYQRKELQSGLKDISATAQAIHRDAHHASWTDAMIRQGQLDEAIKKAAKVFGPA